MLACRLVHFGSVFGSIFENLKVIFSKGLAGNYRSGTGNEMVENVLEMGHGMQMQSSFHTELVINESEQEPEVYEKV